MKIELHVITRAKKEEIIKIKDYSYKIKVSVPPLKHKANDRIIEMLSEYFDIKKTDIVILKGEKTNKKLVEINK